MSDRAEIGDGGFPHGRSASPAPHPRKQGPGGNLPEPVFWPASRGKALTRGLLRAVVAFLCLTAAFLVYRPLWTNPAFGSYRLVDFAIGFAAAPLPIVAILAGVTAARWLVLAVWPAPVGIFADPVRLTLRFGPFGTRSYNAGSLDLKYLFELSADAEEGGFEAFLPEEEQIARFLPRIRVPQSGSPLNLEILRFSAGSEQCIADALRPIISHWRSKAEGQTTGFKP